MLGASLGAGRIHVSEIDGFPVEVLGNHYTIVLVAEDVKGSVARITARLAEDGLNIATLKLSRKHRGGDALMVIEVDEPPDVAVRDHLRALPVGPLGPPSRKGERLTCIARSLEAIRDAEARGASRWAALALETEALDQGRPVEEIRDALRRALVVMRECRRPGIGGRPALRLGSRGRRCRQAAQRTRRARSRVRRSATFSRGRSRCRR